MSLKGGAAGPKEKPDKLYVDMPELQSPPGEYSVMRTCCTLLHHQGPDILRQAIKQCEGVLGSLSPAELENAIRHAILQIQHPETGLERLLGYYPQSDPALDQEVEKAAVALYSAIAVSEDFPAVCERVKTLADPEEQNKALMHFVREYLDHAGECAYEFTKAEQRFQTLYPQSACALPAFMTGIDSQFAGQLQDWMTIRSPKTIDITALLDEDKNQTLFGDIALILPGFEKPVSSAEQRRAEREKFEDLMIDLRSGRIVLDDIKAFMKEADPSLQDMFETRLRHEIKMRLQEFQVSQAEKAKLAEYLKNSGNDPLLDLKNQVQKNALLASQVESRIKNGPSHDEDLKPIFKDEACTAARECLGAASKAQIALQEYEAEPTPARLEQLMELLDRMAEKQQPEALRIVLEYDQRAADVQAKQRQEEERQRMDIAWHLEQQQQTAASKPDASPGMAMSGGMGGGGDMGA